jgi:hypothetical protein
VAATRQAQPTELPVGNTKAGGVVVLGTLNAGKVVASLNRSKTQPFNRVITGLGIRMTGRSVRPLASLPGSRRWMRCAPRPSSRSPGSTRWA